MAFKDILVHLDSCKGCSDRIDAAVALAGRDAARLKGVAFSLKSTVSTYLGIDIPSSLTREQQDLVRKAAQEALARFEKAAREAGITHESEIIECGAAKAPHMLSFMARHHDLTFLGQPDPDEPGGSFHNLLLENVLFESGRPVYIVPYIGRPHMKVRKAVIAWDGGKKAVRAVNEAIPLLQARQEVIILVINPGERKGIHGAHPGRDLAEHLRHHGIDARPDVFTVDDAKPDTVVLNYMSDSGADLLVMGAYSHSRLREKAFGGVTNTILNHMTTPVFMAE